MALGSAWFIVGWVTLHVVALVWAWGTRVAAGSCVENLAHFGFYVVLAAIGAATWIGQQVNVGWFWSAMTLMGMVITAVVDFRSVGEPAQVGIRY
ncbi:MAG: hypothetical protein L0228_00095 [Planctomycetes bacterium]|nr:hypothetical protein [Planctomycetota bacterium]